MNYYWCPLSSPECNPVLRSTIGFTIENWQIAFLIGVGAAVLILCAVMAVAVVWASQRGRA
jgi:hypothetical protein